MLGELIPKVLTPHYTDQVVLLVAAPMRLAVRMFTPLVWSMNALGHGLLRLLRLPPPEEGQGVYAVEALHLLVGQSHQTDVLEDLERQVM